MSRKIEGADVVRISPSEANLKRRLRRHFSSLGFSTQSDGLLFEAYSGKESVRAIHAHQRMERLKASESFTRAGKDKFIKYFASGSEVEPNKIEPVLELVKTGSFSSDLFRFAALTWSVPVSAGFGRRLRYLVWDANNQKIMGLIALGDPVYNLRVRDNFIGWDFDAKKNKLVDLMDAYVLGAVPPYNQLLAGKMIACLIKSRDIYDDFERKYGDGIGVISKINKSPRLLAVTTSSSLGRSSVYNRLKINQEKYFDSLGFTTGWGHFHIPDELFMDLRRYISSKGHRYADGYEFGQGSNWRLRVTKEALSSLGINPKCLRHGIRREVFISLMARNSLEMLNGSSAQPDIECLKSAREVGVEARERWVVGRAERRPQYAEWSSENLLGLFEEKSVARKKINARK